MSEGLKRAREPYRVRNAITGLIIAGAVVGIWAYSISAVKQDVFDDLDEEARALGAGSGPAASASAASTAGVAGGGANTMAITSGGGLTPLHPVKTPAVVVAEAEVEAPKVVSRSNASRGVLATVLDKHLPRALDPRSKTLVWDAPSVDNIGRLGDMRRT